MIYKGTLLAINNPSKLIVFLGDHTKKEVYPLAKKDCVEYQKYKDIIDSNIKRVSNDFFTDLEKIQDVSIKNTIKRLPLVAYNKDFIYGRGYNNLLELVKDLENLNNDNILAKSDLFIISAYYYTYISSSKKLFNLDSLETF